MKFGVSLAAVLAVAACSGCGGGGVSGLVPVTGTVTLNNEPLAGAEITFIPDRSNGNGLPANDLTGPDGNYKVMTQGRAGMVPGKYKVVVSKSMVDMTKVHEDLQDDPYMVALGEGVELTATNADPTMITGEFERDIPAEGGVQDFDVKSTKAP